MRTRNQNNKLLKLAFILAAFLGLSISSVHAAYITGVTIEDVSSEFGTRLAEHTINGNGFTEASGFHVNGNGDGNSWFTNGTVFSPNDPLPAHITFDLGANYDLGSAKVWNYNDTNGGNTIFGARDVTISFATTDVAPTFTSIWTGTFDQAPGSATVDFGQVITLNSSNVRLVRFDISTNWGGGNDWVGLSEVRFTAVVVPEPSTVALLGIGLAGLRLCARRRRRG